MNNNVVPISRARQLRRDDKTYLPPRVNPGVSRLVAGPRRQHLEIGAEWQALADRRLQVHYQPQYNLQTGEMESVEALIRLVDTNGLLIYPERFIDPAENSNVIVPMTRMVFEQVCQDLEIWRSLGACVERVAINLSGRQLAGDRELLSYVDCLLVNHGLHYQDVEFELTERQSLCTSDFGADSLRELANRGSRIVLDDFGVGYSSILYLSELPVSGFKIDRSLVSRVGINSRDSLIVEHMLHLAKDLDLSVVGEGIDNSIQKDILRVCS